MMRFLHVRASEGDRNRDQTDRTAGCSPGALGTLDVGRPGGRAPIPAALRMYVALHTAYEQRIRADGLRSLTLVEHMEWSRHDWRH